MNGEPPSPAPKITCSVPKICFAVHFCVCAGNILACQTTTVVNRWIAQRHTAGNGDAPQDRFAHSTELIPSVQRPASASVRSAADSLLPLPGTQPPHTASVCAVANVDGASDAVHVTGADGRYY